jgi:hypothetical protein
MLWAGKQNLFSKKVTANGNKLFKTADAGVSCSNETRHAALKCEIILYMHSKWDRF